MKTKIIRISALKRNGSHAVANWLASLYDPHYTKFINDLVGKYSTDDLIHTYNKSPIPALYDYELIEPKVIIFNHEDKYLNHINVFVDKESLFGFDLYDVFLLRDFFNQMASRFILKSEKIRNIFPVHEPKYIQFCVYIWKRYAYQFLGMINSLDYFGLRIPINYNRWCIDREYRICITSFFDGATYNEDAIHQVSRYGWGSSFDDNAELEEKIKNSDEEKFRFLTRYKKCLHIPEYRQLFEDEELVCLCNMIFGITYEV